MRRRHQPGPMPLLWVWPCCTHRQRYTIHRTCPWCRMFDEQEAPSPPLQGLWALDLSGKWLLQELSHDQCGRAQGAGITAVRRIDDGGWRHPAPDAGRRGLEFQPIRLEPEDVTRCEGLPVTTVLRMPVDVAAAGLTNRCSRPSARRSFVCRTDCTTLSMRMQREWKASLLGRQRGTLLVPVRVPSRFGQVPEE